MAQDKLAYKRERYKRNKEHCKRYGRMYRKTRWLSVEENKRLKVEACFEEIRDIMTTIEDKHWKQVEDILFRYMK